MEELTLDALLKKIKSDDPDVRTQAWQSAGSVGAAAVKPLAKIVDKGDLEVGRAAKRATILAWKRKLWTTKGFWRLNSRARRPTAMGNCHFRRKPR